MTSIKLVNMNELARGLREVARATKKPHSEILNKALKDVAFRAAQFTAKADPAKIEADLRRDQIGLKMATAKLTGRIGTAFETEKGTRTVRRVTRKQIAKATRELIARRKKVRGYQRAGWLSALIAMGVPIRGKDVKSAPLFLGSAKPATISKLFGEITNKVYSKMKGSAQGHSMRVMERALTRAVQFVTRDRLQYAERKLKSALKKFA